MLSSKGKQSEFCKTEPTEHRIGYSVDEQPEPFAYRISRCRIIGLNNVYKFAYRLLPRGTKYIGKKFCKTKA